MRSTGFTAPGPRAATIESTARALRREVATHNRQVLLIAFFTAFVAALLWSLLYAVCEWLTILATTISEQSEFAIPRGFGVIFAFAALCSLIYTWIDNRLHAHALPRDDKNAAAITADFLLALPRITLSIWGTLRAWLWLDSADHTLAAALLHRLQRDRRVPLHSLPVDLPDEPQRFRILLALQIIRTIEMRRDGNESWLTLNSQRPRSIFAA
ncbi:MAG: hypothetical protein K8R23_00940 [Chthoniobacter sp.]|nr:hypothetical protein [Chthoniobacter sp.]